MKVFIMKKSSILAIITIATTATVTAAAVVAQQQQSHQFVGEGVDVDSNNSLLLSRSSRRHGSRKLSNTAANAANTGHRLFQEGKKGLKQRTQLLHTAADDNTLTGSGGGSISSGSSGSGNGGSQLAAAIVANDNDDKSTVTKEDTSNIVNTLSEGIATYERTSSSHKESNRAAADSSSSTSTTSSSEDEKSEKEEGKEEERESVVNVNVEVNVHNADNDGHQQGDAEEEEDGKSSNNEREGGGNGNEANNEHIINSMKDWFDYNRQEDGSSTSSSSSSTSSESSDMNYDTVPHDVVSWSSSSSSSSYDDPCIEQDYITSWKNGWNTNTNTNSRQLSKTGKATGTYGGWQWGSDGTWWWTSGVAHSSSKSGKGSKSSKSSKSTKGIKCPPKDNMPSHSPVISITTPHPTTPSPVIQVETPMPNTPMPTDANTILPVVTLSPTISKPKTTLAPTFILVPIVTPLPTPVPTPQDSTLPPIPAVIITEEPTIGEEERTTMEPTMGEVVTTLSPVLGTASPTSAVVVDTNPPTVSEVVETGSPTVAATDDTPSPTALTSSPTIAPTIGIESPPPISGATPVPTPSPVEGITIEPTGTDAPTSGSGTIVTNEPTSGSTSTVTSSPTVLQGINETSTSLPSAVPSNSPSNMPSNIPSTMPSNAPSIGNTTDTGTASPAGALVPTASPTVVGETAPTASTASPTSSNKPTPTPGSGPPAGTTYYQNFENGPLSFPDQNDETGVGWATTNLDAPTLVWTRTDELSTNPDDTTQIYSMKSPVLDNELKLPSSSNLTLIMPDQGIGALHFNVKAGNQMPFDAFEYFVDGVIRGQIMGPTNDVVDFDQRVLQVGPGPHKYDFVYKFNPNNLAANVLPPEDAFPDRTGEVFLDEVYFIPENQQQQGAIPSPDDNEVLPTILPPDGSVLPPCVPLDPNPDGFEDGATSFPSSPWSTFAGTMGGLWSISTDKSYGGTSSLRSPTVRVSSTSNATLQLCDDFLGGVLKLQAYASVQPPTDLFIIYVDGEAAAQLVDVNEWTELDLGLEPGSHLIEFSYQYNPFDVAELPPSPPTREGAVWIDNVEIETLGPVMKKRKDGRLS